MGHITSSATSPDLGRARIPTPIESPTRFEYLRHKAPNGEKFFQLEVSKNSRETCSYSCYTGCIYECCKECCYKLGFATRADGEVVLWT